MTKERITIEQNPLTKESLTLNGYELPQYSVQERKGRVSRVNYTTSTSTTA